MRVVQTFWSGNKDPLKDNFGWADPQFHLMSWALSCLSLRESYDEVVLYTDSVGYKIFSEILELPYTDIIVQYDNLSCSPVHWAYPKLLTYSLQDKPFIHVDGDVYLPKRLAPEVEAGELIAQNREIGTEYYKRMMNAIQRNDILIPDFLKREVQKESIPSYNAGVIGGSDIGFIQKYCRAAFDFIESNRLNDSTNKNLNVNHNILFEQIMFYALTANENRTVTTVLPHDVKDNGYSYQGFCNFYSYDKYTLMHLIGGHKRNPKASELLAKTLLIKYPDYYKKIIKLFPKKNKRFSQSAIKYPSKAISKRWKNISNSYLFDLEYKMCNYFEFINSSDEERLGITIKKNPHISTFERTDKQDNKKTEIACVPTLVNSGIQETIINDLCYNILTLLKRERTFGELLDELKPCFPIEKGDDEKKMLLLVLKEMEYLFVNKLIYTEKLNGK